MVNCVANSQTRRQNFAKETSLAHFQNFSFDHNIFRVISVYGLIKPGDSVKVIQDS